MKKLALAVSLALLGIGQSQAAWQGHLDLSPVVSPLMIRELHDGQWLAGLTKENLWHLDQDGVQRLHVGIFQAWNAEHGNATFGPLIGLDIPAYLSQAIGALGAGLGAAETFKPAQYAADLMSVDAFVGYRPVHTADVIGDLTYGVAMRLKLGFGVKELQKGL